MRLGLSMASGRRHLRTLGSRRAAAEGMHGIESGDDQRQVDAAFNRVLEAEARARLKVEECQRQAAAQIAGAAERAREVERRSEARTLLVHRLADASVARALANLQTVGETSEGRDLAAPSRLDAVVAALADEMIGLAAAAPAADPEGA